MNFWANLANFNKTAAGSSGYSQRENAALAAPREVPLEGSA